MPPDTPDELIVRGARVMAVCNACRYCEHYCPVFPAMERRQHFNANALRYLANLCHNCGECLYACQYAPPHEFGINVPKLFDEIRHRSYDAYAWPPPLARAFRHHGSATALAWCAVFVAVLLASTLLLNPDALWQPGPDADFYRVVPHGVMVGLFGVVSFAVLVVVIVGMRRCWRDLEGNGGGLRVRGALGRALRDALTLRHLHGSGADCVTREEQRGPWRRWFHHCTAYGFLLCFASTSVAAAYHAAGIVAPYGYASAPVLLGTAGGVGLLIGPAGLWVLRRRRDPELTDAPRRAALDDSLLLLLFLTSLTGLLLLALRHQTVMGLLLVVHLGVVLALLVTLPYGKFVHGLYRTLALLKYANEDES